MRWPVLLVLFVFITSEFAHAQNAAGDNTPKYSNEFLNIGVDARALAMSGSMTAHANDVSAGYWNPAGLTGLQADNQLGLLHASYFAGIANYDYAGFATRLSDSSALSVSVIRFAVDDIPDTRFLFDANGAVNYDNIRFFAAADYAFLISYARQLPWLGGIQIGMSTKVIRRVVGDFANSWGFGLDLGLQKSVRKWQLGLMVKDISGTFNSWAIQTDELRAIYALTGNDLNSQSLEITLPRVVLGVSRNFKLGDQFNILAALDLTSTFDGKRNTLLRTNTFSMDPAAGMEIGFRQMAFLRAGVGQFQQIKRFDLTQEWSFQPNLGIGLAIKELRLDYAFTDIGDQAAGLYSHVFSVKVNFHVDE